MRILILSNLYPPNVVGGYERLCFEVTSGLAAQGHELTVLTSRYGGKTADYPGQVILRELELLTGPDIYTPFAGSAAERARLNQANLETLDRAIATSRPDVIFAWNLFFLDPSFLDRLERSPLRTVVMLTDNWLLVMRNPGFVSAFFRDHVHGDKAFTPRAETALAPEGLLARIQARLSGRPPGLRLQAIFGSAFMRDFYAAGGIRFGRDRVIHNGVRQSAYAGAPTPDRRALVQPGVLRLLFAGRLVDLKGAQLAVAALPLLDPAAFGLERIELTLLGDGQDAAYMAKLNQAIAESPCREAISLRPAVPEAALFDVFSAHDIYLFPSLYEPFSLTLIHALACGIPTIASRVGGNPEIVEDGKTGLLFDKNDPQDLARAVRRMARDPALRAELAKAGRLAASAFTFEAMVRRMQDFLETPA
jgi:glycosyltransferase involved in cell wall biosynthesis